MGLGQVLGFKVLGLRLGLLGSCLGLWLVNWLGKGSFRVRVRIRVKLGEGLGWQFDANNILTLTPTRMPIINFNCNQPN